MRILKTLALTMALALSVAPSEERLSLISEDGGCLRERPG